MTSMIPAVVTPSFTVDFGNNVCEGGIKCRHIVTLKETGQTFLSPRAAIIALLENYLIDIPNEFLHHGCKPNCFYKTEKEHKQGHIDCPCWTSGRFKHVDSCTFHPWEM